MVYANVASVFISDAALASTCVTYNVHPMGWMRAKKSPERVLFLPSSANTNYVIVDHEIGNFAQLKMQLFPLILIRNKFDNVSWINSVLIGYGHGKLQIWTLILFTDVLFSRFCNRMLLSSSRVCSAVVVVIMNALNIQYKRNHTLFHCSIDINDLAPRLDLRVLFTIYCWAWEMLVTSPFVNIIPIEN